MHLEGKVSVDNGEKLDGRAIKRNILVEAIISMDNSVIILSRSIFQIFLGLPFCRFNNSLDRIAIEKPEKYVICKKCKKKFGMIWKEDFSHPDYSFDPTIFF